MLFHALYYTHNNGRTTIPRELIYIETGLLDIETTIKTNRINYANSMTKTSKKKLGKITKRPHKGS